MYLAKKRMWHVDSSGKAQFILPLFSSRTTITFLVKKFMQTAFKYYCIVKKFIVFIHNGFQLKNLAILINC